MSESAIKSIEDALRGGKADAAVAAAREVVSAQGDSRDTGIAIAKAAAAVYRDLIAPPVIEFTEKIATELPSESGQVARKALERLFRINDEWEKRLWAVHVERLARELRDWTRLRHIDSAASNVSRLMALAPDGQRERRASYIGGTLATVLNNQKEAKQLLAMLARHPEKYFVLAEEVAVIEKARETRFNQMMGTNLDNLEREYSSVLAETAMEIKNLLPDGNRMDEPEEKEIREVGDAFRSLFRVPILREESDLFLDATNVIAEYIPKEQTATSKMARVEARIHGTLGFTAKKTVALVLMDIGRNSFLTTVYKGWAKEYLGTDAIGNIVEVMGALRTNDFADFLKKVQSDRSISASVSSKLASAYGSIAGEAATETLMAELRTILGKRRIETAELREAEQVITNLGIIVKSPRTSDQERTQIREFARSHVPEDLSRLARHTALELFTYKPGEQSPQLRHWAVRVLTRALFAADETTAHHKGDAGKMLGEKAPVVDALVKLVPLEVNTFVHALEPLTARYGSGFMASAEVAEKVSDPALLPLLDRMLTNTLLHDDSAQNIYQQEFYWDPATEERKPLTKEIVLSPLVYSIGMIGGEKSKEILRRYQQQISTNRVHPPSAEVANLLQRFLGDEAFGEGAIAASDGSGVVLDPAEVRSLIKQITSRYLLTGKEKRRMQKVAALTKLAQGTPPEAMDAVFQQLGDKDPMVVSATITCLAEYAQPHKDKISRDLAINEAIDCLGHKDPAIRSNAVKLIKEIGPGRKDVKTKLTAFAKTVDKADVKLAIAQALKSSPHSSDGMGQLAALAAGEEGESAKGEPEVPNAMSQLEIKRQYMADRKAWIDGGKRGDPPAKPPGLD